MTARKLSICNHAARNSTVAAGVTSLLAKSAHGRIGYALLSRAPANRPGDGGRPDTSGQPLARSRCGTAHRGIE
ncbi:hypothetical protein [Nocardia vulneris]|nr:hypothetical protein [Nocardia vulneris]